MLSPEEPVRYMGQLNMDQHEHGRNMKVLWGLVLLVGWLVIVIGATRFVGRVA